MKWGAMVSGVHGLEHDEEGATYFLAQAVCPLADDSTGLERGKASSRGGRIETRKPKVLHVRFQESASWLTPRGVEKKRKMIEAKGIPNLTGRRFITVTIDQDRFAGCPLTAYLVAKEHLRRFLEAGRVAGLWDRGCWWAWKMEFHRNGWPHWHILLDRTKKFSVTELKTIEKIWGLGGTNVRRIAKGEFGYHFKYAFKGVFQEDSEGSGLCVPQWFLDYYKPSSGDDRPQSFERVRFWQTSKGFYTGPKIEVPPAAEPLTCRLPRRVSEVLTERKSSVLVIARERCGKYKRSTRLSLGVSRQQFIKHHLWDAENGAGCTLTSRSFCLDPETVRKVINENQRWKLQHLIESNKLTLARARQLRRDRQSLLTC